MPRGDGTGPVGQGPKSGRGLGNCGANTENKRNFFGFGGGLGRRMGRGQGLGRGFGRKIANNITTVITDK